MCVLCVRALTHRSMYVDCKGQPQGTVCTPTLTLFSRQVLFVKHCYTLPRTSQTLRSVVGVSRDCTPRSAGIRDMYLSVWLFTCILNSRTLGIRLA